MGDVLAVFSHIEDEANVPDEFSDGQTMIEGLK